MIKASIPHKLTVGIGAIVFAALLIAVGAATNAGAATAPGLGDASSYAVLAATTVTNTGPTTVEGDVGVAPGTEVTGFPPGTLTGTIHEGDAHALNAQGGASAAFDALGDEACTADLTGQDLGGMTLTEGVYCFSSSAQLTGTLTLNAAGSDDAVFIFKTGSTLTTASNSSVVMINGGDDCNAFWQIGSSATLGTDTVFLGNIIARTSNTLNTGASVSGRVLALDGAVTLDSNTVGFSACTVPTATPSPTAAPTGTPTPTPSPTPVGATPTPTPVGQTPTPVPTPTPTGPQLPPQTPTDFPRTGGPPATGGFPWMILLLAAVALSSAGATMLVLSRGGQPVPAREEDR